MIVGSGLLAQAFSDRYGESPNACVYAAGVSNSACTDPSEFARERERLETALGRSRDLDVFVYFSTCSIEDTSIVNSLYVKHKVAMEALVARHDRYLIARLPQVVGRTPNPHTLLNYLYARIARSEQFMAWTNATRNVIDVSDVAATVSQLMESSEARRVTINVANPRSVTVGEIVAALEAVVGKPAVVQWVEAGFDYRIDVSAVLPTYRELKLDFDENYLSRVTEKYYGN